MGTYIFRNPFVTKKDKAVAREYFDMAGTLLTAAELSKDENGVPDARLTVQAIHLMGLAARRLGFRNIKDAHDYVKIHGKL